MKYKIQNLDQNDIQNLVGINDENLTLLEDLYGCGIVCRDDYLKLLSDDTEIFNKFSRHMDYIISHIKSDVIDHDFIKQSFIYINEHPEEKDDFSKEIIAYSYNGRPFKCKTLNQYKLIKAIRQNDLVFSIGPAGTGKTFLAVMMAINAFKRGDVKKIVITRPAVEAGESLGFLPGDLKEKIDPYLMPIYDALDIILGKEQKDKLIEKGCIEVIPLAYMRGRTLDEAFIILDEAQNTTDTQMLMFLTRLGFNSKMVVNGDVTQIDLNISRKKSGLVIADQKLSNIDKITFVYFDNSDVVRNPLVQVIIERFDLD
ncbi:MAG: PhoH family protein [Erysipelotrichaceae bacterium]|nr:PhoH family protein [Erysipelotrichaceae bacterium]